LHGSRATPPSRNSSLPLGLGSNPTRTAIRYSQHVIAHRVILPLLNGRIERLARQVKRNLAVLSD